MGDPGPIRMNYFQGLKIFQKKHPIWSTLTSTRPSQRGGSCPFPPGLWLHTPTWSLLEAFFAKKDFSMSAQSTWSWVCKWPDTVLFHSAIWKMQFFGTLDAFCGLKPPKPRWDRRGMTSPGDSRIQRTEDLSFHFFIDFIFFIFWIFLVVSEGKRFLTRGP